MPLPPEITGAAREAAMVLYGCESVLEGPARV